jgi:hypothetical protein
MSIGYRPHERGDEVEFWLAQAAVERRRPRVRIGHVEPVVPPTLWYVAALAGVWLLGRAL